MRFSIVKSRDDGFFRPCAKTLHFEVSKFSEQTAIFDQKRHAKQAAIRRQRRDLVKQKAKEARRERNS